MAGSLGWQEQQVKPFHYLGFFNYYFLSVGHRTEGGGRRLDGTALFKLQPPGLEGVPIWYGSRAWLLSSRSVDPHVGVCALWGKLTGSSDLKVTETQ